MASLYDDRPGRLKTVKDLFFRYAELRFESEMTVHFFYINVGSLFYTFNHEEIFLTARTSDRQGIGIPIK